MCVVAPPPSLKPSIILLLLLLLGFHEARDVQKLTELLLFGVVLFLGLSFPLYFILWGGVVVFIWFCVLTLFFMDLIGVGS